MGAAVTHTVSDDMRVAAIDALGLSAPGPERAYSDIAALAAELFGTSMAVVSIVGREAQWFIGRFGLDLRGTSRDASFCTYTIQAHAPLVVRDALEDERFKSNPYVLGGPRVRFYAGAPIYAPTGECVGAVCVMDGAPRAGLSPTEHVQLLRLAHLAETQLVGRAYQHGAQREAAARIAAEAHTDAVLEEACDAFTACDRLSVSLDRRLRDSLQRIQRQIEDMRPLCDAPQWRALRTNVVTEVAALWDMTDEMAAVARLDAHAARRSVEMFSPAAVVSEIIGGISAVAGRRGVSLRLADATQGDAILGDPFRFEELIEQVLSDVIAQTEDAAVALEIAFEPAAPRGARMSLKLSGESGWATRVESWRLGARSRELIGALAGVWDVLADQRRITLSLPARLRAPARVAERQPATRTNTRSRSEHCNEISL